MGVSPLPRLQDFIIGDGQLFSGRSKDINNKMPFIIISLTRTLKRCYIKESGPGIIAYINLSACHKPVLKSPVDKVK